MIVSAESQVADELMVMEKVSEKKLRIVSIVGARLEPIKALAVSGAIVEHNSQSWSPVG